MASYGRKVFPAYWFSVKNFAFCFVLRIVGEDDIATNAIPQGTEHEIANDLVRAAALADDHEVSFHIEILIVRTPLWAR